MTKRRLIGTPLALVIGVGLLSIFPGASEPVRASAATSATASGSWAMDSIWYDGQAEWALYDAVRPIYGIDRRYEATIFTNKQRMSPQTTTKASDWRASDAIEVFKHNLSEMIPTENYTYRFLTTSFIRTDDLTPFKIAFSSQEDCGATYKQFVVADDTVQAESFCYFPDDGASRTEYRRDPKLAFHDALSLTLRDFPFDADTKPTVTLSLIPDQTDTHETAARPAEATVTYVERTTLTVPYGTIDAHHLRVTHARDGGTTTTHIWFAAEPSMLNVMVRYEGPFGVRYELKRLGRWAYWDRAAPRPQ